MVYTSPFFEISFNFSQQDFVISVFRSYTWVFFDIFSKLVFMQLLSFIYIFSFHCWVVHCKYVEM